MATGIRALLFDMDGLLLDTEDLHMRAFAETAVRLGFPCRPEDFTCWIGRGSSETSQWLAERCRVPATPERIFQMEQESYLDLLLRERPRPLPGVQEMIGVCDEHGFRRGLVTSTGYAQMVSTMAVVLSHLGRPEDCAQTFHALTTGDRVTRRKPDPEPYLRTAQELDMEPAACLVFEDSPAGVAAGRAAGCRVVAIPSPYLNKAEVEREAHASFPTLAEACLARVWEIV